MIEKVLWQRDENNSSIITVHVNKLIVLTQNEPTNVYFNLWILHRDSSGQCMALIEIGLICPAQCKLCSVNHENHEIQPQSLYHYGYVQWELSLLWTVSNYRHSHQMTNEPPSITWNPGPDICIEQPQSANFALLLLSSLSRALKELNGIGAASYSMCVRTDPGAVREVMAMLMNFS